MAVADQVLSPPLLRSLTVLAFLARHLDPLSFDETVQAIVTPEDDLRAALAEAEAKALPQQELIGASRHALAAFGELRTALAEGADFYALYRALRHLPRAEAALYPLAHQQPAVNAFFLDPSLRDDPEASACRAIPARAGESGVIQFDNEPGSRGGFSVYVPEFYRPDRAWPLVAALHGGSGHGSGFLWSWLRDARSFGAILIAPTATGRTWALMGDDPDTPNLNRALDFVASRWRIDPARRLLTGMSDGGTFCYVSGLAAASRFTHLAPVAATFHPLMAAMADAGRLSRLPIHVVHGARDWMFPVEVARHAAAALKAAGGDVRYREIEDLSHCYPREINGDLLAWMAGTPREEAAG